MSRLEPRTCVIYDLPLPADTVILRPEQAVIRFKNNYTADVGSLCYMRRGIGRRPAGQPGQVVDLASFNIKRAEHARALISYFSGEGEATGRSERTRASKAQGFVSLFMRWADENGHSLALESEEHARAAFVGYLGHLRERVAMGKIANNTAVQQQDWAYTTLTECLNIDDLLRGVRHIRFDGRSTTPIPPPSEEEEAKVLALCESLFKGLSELVLDQKEYPFKLTVPKYLGLPDDGIWVFPTNPWCADMTGAEPTSNLRQRPYDFANGCLKPLEEITHLYKWPHKAVDALRLAQVGIDKANQDFHSRHRHQLGVTALSAFVVLFFAYTGMNPTQVFELKWSDDYEVSTERQGFRVIKSRAANRICHFEIDAVFLPTFKAFLKLRDYLRQGHDCEYLFFNLGQNCTSKPKKIFSSMVPSLLATLRKIDANVPKISPQEWRAAKSDWLVRKTDPSTSALILQNSEQTVIRHYVAGSESVHMEEMSSFFNKVSETVVSQGVVIANGVERAVGICGEYGNPHSFENNAPVPSDCRAAEGCLFCDKFRVHADERDTRKLLSCRYCLQQTSPLAASEEQFQSLFGAIFDRIELLLAEIERRVPGLASRLQREIEEGELDPYWAAKLELLLNLELI